jgi:hypothetical protein
MTPKTLTAIVLCVFAVTLVSGQSQNHEVFLVGTVYDQVGDVCLGATVIAATATGKQFETITDKDGNYRIPLPVYTFKPGGDFKRKISEYTVKAILPGFKVTEISGLKYVPTKIGVVRLDIILEVGLMGDS